MRQFRLPMWLTRWMRDRAFKLAGRRDPDNRIFLNGEQYIDRWKLLPVNRMFNVFVHKIYRSDDDRARHDHPWDNASIILFGHYIEETAKGTRWRDPGDVVFRKADEVHRLVLAGSLPVWTIFVRFQTVRDWGFLCTDGRWFQWRRFISMKENLGVANPCEEPELLGDDRDKAYGRDPDGGA